MARLPTFRKAAASALFGVVAFSTGVVHGQPALCDLTLEITGVTRLARPANLPANQVPAYVCSVSFKVSNRGTAASQPSAGFLYSDFTLDGQNLGFHVVQRGTLSAGQTYQSSTLLWRNAQTDCPAAPKVWAKIDPGNAVQESNEMNNATTFPAPTGPLPDLVTTIKSVHVTARPPTADSSKYPQYMCELVYEVTNQGSAPAESPTDYLSTSFSLNGERLTGQGIPHRGVLAAGASVTDSVTLFKDRRTPCFASAKVSVEVDPADVILESQEGNNIATFEAGGTANTGVVARSCVETGSTWPTRSIPVCWEEPAMDGAYADFRNIVRAGVRRTWESFSEVVFFGWEPCPPPNPALFGGIRISVADENPRVVASGKNLAGVPGGMLLNFTYGKWEPSCASSGALDCTEKIAIHEFGHALGFGHEQNRSDTQLKWCSAEDAPQGGSCDMYGPWDRDSVMNYCSPTWNGDGNLSPGDIAVVQQFYGRAVADPGIRYAAPSNSLQLAWSFHGQVPGWNCIAINEAKDPAGWSDNFLCTKGTNPFQWSSRGRIPGLDCLQFVEGSEEAGTGWENNYLCYKPGTLQTKWKMDGPLEGWSCLQIYEPDDSVHTWLDNYLCFAAQGTDVVGLFTAEFKEAGGLTGHRSDKFFGGICPGGFQRKQCLVRREADSGDVNCGDLATGTGEWTSTSATSCECKVHLGADAFEWLHCRAQVTGQCRSGFRRCGDTCGCGSCGSFCSIDQDCEGGACKPRSCPSGQKSCDGTCVDLNTDRRNCGACGVMCNKKYEVCSNRKCRLKDGPSDD